jgi:hypothetical protein
LWHDGTTVQSLAVMHVDVSADEEKRAAVETVSGVPTTG